MKVHVYGNTLNSAYFMCKNLRNQGVDAYMFLDNTSQLQQDYPWWDDKNLSKDNLPHWVRYYETRPFFLFPKSETRRMIKDFAKCDVALVSCFGPILAMKAKVPFIFYSLGDDLNTISYRNEWMKIIYSKINFKSKFRKLVKIILYIRLQRKAIIKKSNKIIVYMGYQVNEYINKNNLAYKTHKLCYPKNIIDFVGKENLELSESYKKYDHVFFMISRHSWISVWEDLKGNDKFIKGFAKFIESGNPNVLLITAEKGQDYLASKKLVKDLGIESKVQWVKDMPKYKLKEFLSMPNVVIVDNFWHNDWLKKYSLDKDYPRVGFGFGGIEALSFKKELITTFTDTDFYNNSFPSSVYNAFTEDEIHNQLLTLNAKSDTERILDREKGYDFILKWHEQSMTLYKHIDLLKEVYSNEKLID